MYLKIRQAETFEEDALTGVELAGWRYQGFEKGGLGKLRRLKKQADLLKLGVGKSCLKNKAKERNIWIFPKIGVPPNHPF